MSSSAAGHSARAAECSYAILPLPQLTQQSPVAVIADGYREQQESSGGFTSTLQVRGTIKGRPPGPYVTIQGLGHPNSGCGTGPRLQPGTVYVLFIEPNGDAQTSPWSLVDADGSVYTLAPSGVLLPPDQPGGAPRPSPIAPAELVRRIGTLARSDTPRIDDLINQLNLPDTSVAAPVSTQKPFYERLPLRETALIIAGIAVVVAGLTLLLWRPQHPRVQRRP